jgi:putative membrane protein
LQISCLSLVSDWDISRWVTCAPVAAGLVWLAMQAYLCFSDRLIYPSCALVDRPFGLEALQDQIAAEAFMWVFGSVVFLIPAIYLTARFLANGRLMDEKTGLEAARAMAQ